MKSHSNDWRSMPSYRSRQRFYDKGRIDDKKRTARSKKLIFLILGFCIMFACLTYYIAIGSSIFSKEDNTKLLVFYPFIYQEIGKLNNSIQVHWFQNAYDESDLFQPCSGIHQKNTDLALAYNGDVDDPTDGKNIILHQFLNGVKKRVGHCFNDIYFSSFKLEAWQEGHPAGVSFMVFYAIMYPEKYFHGGDQYASMQIMETDVYPVRKDWLDTVFAHAFSVDPFWIKGSFFQGEEWNILTDVPAWTKNDLNFWGTHINGAALYNMKDKNFKKFVLSTMNHYPPHLDWAPYDITLAKEKMTRMCMDPKSLEGGVTVEIGSECLKFRRSTSHLFQYSMYIQNLGVSVFDEQIQTRIMLRDKNTVLIHGTAVSNSRSRVMIEHNTENDMKEQSNILSFGEKYIYPITYYNANQLCSEFNKKDCGLIIWHVPRSAGTKLLEVIGNYIFTPFVRMSSVEDKNAWLNNKPMMFQMNENEPNFQERLSFANEWSLYINTTKLYMTQDPQRVIFGSFLQASMSAMSNLKYNNYMVVVPFRDPADMRNSLFYYLKSIAPKNSPLLNMSFTAFLDDNSHMSINNFICMGLTGMDNMKTHDNDDLDINLAVNNLKYVFIIMQNRFTESILVLRDYLKIDGYFPVDGLSYKTHSGEEELPQLSFSEITALRRTNWCDLRVYDVAKSQFERQLATYLTPWSDDCLNNWKPDCHIYHPKN